MSGAACHSLLCHLLHERRPDVVQTLESRLAMLSYTHRAQRKRSRPVMQHSLRVRPKHTARHAHGFNRQLQAGEVGSELASGM